MTIFVCDTSQATLLSLFPYDTLWIAIATITMRYTSVDKYKYTK